MQKKNSTTYIEDQKKILEFLSQEFLINKESITLESSLFHDLGIDGEDASELLNSYAIRFNVDVKDIDFMRHFGNEGTATPFALLKNLLTGNKQTNKIPITINDLVEGINSGKLTPENSTAPQKN
ncbi:DUF1493 family protein [Pseudomonas solani]|uniref:DUF1493 family protein n=1 Tax=Pseudomonas solani TaxID=2731552 RepID=UPI0035BE8657